MTSNPVERFSNPAARVARDLKRRCAAVVQVPGDPGYETSRLAWNLAADQRPAAVALPRTAADVSEVIVAASAAGLRVAAQATGHGARALVARGMDDVVLLRTAALNGVEVDPSRRLARVGGGITWSPVVEHAARHRLAALHGSAPDVGVVGYSLGGGISWYARKFGLASGLVRAVDLATTTGGVIRVDAQQDADLFDALRAGGAGSFGVVTGMTFGLIPMSTVYGGMMVWPIEHAKPVLRAWLNWCETAPDQVSTMFRLLNLPELPGIPAQLRGRSVMIDGAVLPDGCDADTVLRPLLAVPPSLDTFAWRAPAELARIHLDPEHPIPSESSALIVDRVEDDVIEGLVGSFSSGTPLAFAGFRQLGGALQRGGLRGSFLFQAGGAAGSGSAGEAVRASVAPTLTALRRRATGVRLLGFTEDPVDPRTAFDDATWRRMSAARSRIDPDALFVANHPIA